MNRLSIYKDELESVSKLLLGRCEVRIVLFDILNMYFLELGIGFAIRCVL